VYSIPNDCKNTTFFAFSGMHGAKKCEKRRTRWLLGCRWNFFPLVSWEHAVGRDSERVLLSK
jgi:hypothetical protein